MVPFIQKGCDIIMGDRSPKKREKKKKAAVRPAVERVSAPELERIKKQKKTP